MSTPGNLIFLETVMLLGDKQTLLLMVCGLNRLYYNLIILVCLGKNWCLLSDNIVCRYSILHALLLRCAACPLPRTIWWYYYSMCDRWRPSFLVMTNGNHCVPNQIEAVSVKRHWSFYANPVSIDRQACVVHCIVWPHWPASSQGGIVYSCDCGRQAVIL